LNTNAVDIITVIAKETGIPRHKVEHTVNLLADNTIPFIARYRKEQTGELDEEQIRSIDELNKHYTALEQRKAEIIRLIDRQGKLTVELQAKIISCTKLSKLEDLYLPYKPKRKTRAAWPGKMVSNLWPHTFCPSPVGQPGRRGTVLYSEAVPTVEEALQGACDIVAENVAEDADVRSWVRDQTRRSGCWSPPAATRQKTKRTATITIIENGKQNCTSPGAGHKQGRSGRSAERLRRSG
jgi:uncharacterized protein